MLRLFFLGTSPVDVSLPTGRPVHVFQETLSSSLGSGPVMSELFVDHKGGGFSRELLPVFFLFLGGITKMASQVYIYIGRYIPCFLVFLFLHSQKIYISCCFSPPDQKKQFSWRLWWRLLSSYKVNFGEVPSTQAR